MSGFAQIPMRFVGPLKVSGPTITGEYEVPLATYETPIWPSVNRGARVSRHCGEGIRCTVVDDRMTRSILLEAPDAAVAFHILGQIKTQTAVFSKITEKTGRFVKFVGTHAQIAGNLLFLRFEFTTGDAAGHNMCTRASEALASHILECHSELKYGSISGNYCSDKKATAVNGILGRGKYVVAETVIPGKSCRLHLKTTPEKIVQINLRKNLIGTMLAGGLRSANAHFANMLLGFYLATGQDAANIIEGSQGLTMAEKRGEGLYFSVTLPNLILGTIGNGKGLDFVIENQRRMGLDKIRRPGENARRLACLCAAAVLCGELSLLAALTNPGELMEAHCRLERN